MAGDRGLAMTLGAMGWLFFPVLAPPRLPVPRPCGRPTPGSAGPAQRSCPPGLSCCLDCIQSPPCRGARHPVRRGHCCCCSCCVCHRCPEDMEKKRRRRNGRRKEGDGQRGGDTERGRWREEEERKREVTQRKEHVQEGGGRAGKALGV